MEARHHIPVPGDGDALAQRPRQRPAKPARAMHRERPVPPLAPLRGYLRRALVRSIDRGWFGLSPTYAHLVICGFPRSGTTLLQLMVQTAIPEARCFGRERSGLGIARRHWPGRAPYLITKRPDDIFWIDEIREFYAQLGTQTRPRFVICKRDPRAVLTSRHELNRKDYWVSVDRWRAIYEHYQYALRANDVCAVDFKDLITHTAGVQRQLTALVGWTVSTDFEEFHQRVPQDFDTRALNGVRTLDRDALERWTRPEHDERMRYLLQEMPELPDRLIEMGYERDHTWTTAYR